MMNGKIKIHEEETKELLEVYYNNLPASAFFCLIINSRKQEKGGKQDSGDG